MTVVLVAGAVANKPFNGGAAWTRLSWARSLEELGFHVHLVEQLREETVPGAVSWFVGAVSAAGLAHRSTLLRPDGSTAWGLTLEELADLAASASLLVNISGHLDVAEVCKRVPTRVFVDLDPGYTQVWDADGSAPLADHDHWFTVGQLVGTSASAVPAHRHRWRPVRQPVVLDDWPMVPPPADASRFTTVGAWRGSYGPVRVAGRFLGPKAHEFRRFLPLPRRVGATFELALQIDEADDKDRKALTEHGWSLVDPVDVASDLGRFRSYVQGSAGEFSVAQAVYVHSRSGWISDRTTRYLATGRPAVVQDTGISRTLPCGEGLIAFRTLDEAATAVERVRADFDSHCRSARTMAEELFSPAAALGPLLEEVGVGP